MDFQTRKLNLISYLAQVQDERLLDKIESYIIKNKTKFGELDLKPFTIDEYISRIEKSERDFKNGKYKTQDELEKISEKW